MNKKGEMLGMLAMLMAAGSAQAGREYEPDLNNSPTKKFIPKGHKQFFVNGVEVWALNRKNAEKKYHRENAPFR
jgi:hypothetical protein